MLLPLVATNCKYIAQFCHEVINLNRLLMLIKYAFDKYQCPKDACVLNAENLRLRYHVITTNKYKIQSFSLAKMSHVIYQLTVPRDYVTR